MKNAYTGRKMIKIPVENIDKTKPILLIAGTEDPVGNYGEALIELNKLYNQYGIENTF
jgi:alpha-beta hydrolase superfamily lysophospholipase